MVVIEMFSDIIEKNNEAKSFLVDSNKTLDNGEMYIEDGNDNKVTDEILESIEDVEKKTNTIYDDINSINADIQSFNDAILESRRIRQEELKSDDPGDSELDIRDIL
jgi:division protein CdvB (Snf7/Vps24/ESCRT-III family)